MTDRPVYGFHEDDLVTCPLCGSRTDFETSKPDEHVCLGCGHEFIVEIDEEDPT